MDDERMRDRFLDCLAAMRDTTRRWVILDGKHTRNDGSEIAIIFVYFPEMIFSHTLQRVGIIIDLKTGEGFMPLEIVDSHWYELSGYGMKNNENDIFRIIGRMAKRYRSRTGSVTQSLFGDVEVVKDPALGTFDGDDAARDKFFARVLFSLDFGNSRTPLTDPIPSRWSEVVHVDGKPTKVVLEIRDHSAYAVQIGCFRRR